WSSPSCGRWTCPKGAWWSTRWVTTALHTSILPTGRSCRTAWPGSAGRDSDESGGKAPLRRRQGSRARAAADGAAPLALKAGGDRGRESSAGSGLYAAGSGPRLPPPPGARGDHLCPLRDGGTVG